MSGNTATVEQILKDFFAGNYCEMAIIAAIIYQYITTISEEVQFMWSRKPSKAKMNMLLNRYSLLLYACVNIIAFFPWNTAPSCEATIVMFDVTLLMLYVMAIGFSVLRVYAISHGNKSIALATFIFGVITVPLNIYLYSAESYAYVFYLAGMPTCDQTPNFSNTLYFQFDIVIRCSTIISDTLVLLVTWYCTHSFRKTANAIGMQLQLTSMLVQNGTFYFITLLAFNLAVIIVDRNQQEYASSLIYMIAPVSSMLLQQFMIDLQKVHEQAATCDTLPFFLASFPHDTTIIFAPGDSTQDMDHVHEKEDADVIVSGY